MTEVLVLVDHVDGSVKKTTSELLTLASRIGQPSAVLFGSGADAARGSVRAAVVSARLEPVPFPLPPLRRSWSPMATPY